MGGDWWEGPTMTIGHHTQADPPVGLVGYETDVTDVTDTPTDLQKGRKKKHKKLLLAGGSLGRSNFIWNKKISSRLPAFSSSTSYKKLWLHSANAKGMHGQSCDT